MNENQTDEFLHGLLQQIIEAEGFTDKPKITIKAGSELGDGFSGINSAIEIESEGKTLKLFAKRATKNEPERRQVYTDKLFGREILFYDTIYAEFLNFQLGHNVKQPFNNVPRCYITSTENLNEILIYENLKEQGYRLYDKEIEMNDQHILFIFKLYARFHAISYAMKDKNPQLYAKLSKNLCDIHGIILKATGMDLVLAHYSEEAKQIFDTVEDSYISSRIKNLPEILVHSVLNTKEYIDEYSVITHCDCWFNNFLFKYKDSNDYSSLEDIKILDWQIMQVNSPVLDLCKFFYGIATKRAMAQLNFYLKIYHDTLSESIKEMGSDPEKLYPYHVFRDHWKKFSRHGLAIAFLAVRMMFTEREEIPNTSEAMSSGKKMGDVFIFKICREELYQQRIKTVIEHFVSNDFI